jgi:hypothetical protein
VLIVNRVFLRYSGNNRKVAGVKNNALRGTLQFSASARVKEFRKDLSAYI